MTKAKVLVMNTSEEIIEMLCEVMRYEGFEAVSEFTHNFKKKEAAFTKYIEKIKPNLILYDIAIPYEENYKLFLKLGTIAKQKGIKIILTTTNKEALEKIVGKTNAFEIVGKPYDLDLLIRFVNKALFGKVDYPPQIT
ncbi:MAG TPA: hypothetical protein VG917_05365 [Patescibacteria group bacterium]|nr:hypothetical protein [Patescibacteria group bacterium]